MTTTIEALEKQLKLYVETRAIHESSLNVFLNKAQEKRNQIMACDGAIEACQSLITQAQDAERAAAEKAKAKASKKGKKPAAKPVKEKQKDGQ